MARVSESVWKRVTTSQKGSRFNYQISNHYIYSILNLLYISTISAGQHITMHHVRTLLLSLFIWFLRSHMWTIGPVTHRCWCCRCGQWCQAEGGSSWSLWKPCRRLGNSRPGWLSGSCGCGIGSMWAWACLEALGCPESGSGNLCTWSRSCGPRNYFSCPGPVAGETTG